MFRPEQSSLNKIISRDSLLLKRQTRQWGGEVGHTFFW